MKNKQSIKTSIRGLILNTLNAILKTAAGILSGSSALLVDGLNSFADALSSLIALFSFWYAKRPADKEHPYGHERIESIGGFLVTLLMIVLGVELLQTSFSSILNPTPLTLDNKVFVLTIVSIVIKAITTLIYFKNRHLSKLMVVNYHDSRNDLLMSCTVLFSLLNEQFFNIQIDGYLALLLSIFIIHNAFKMIREFVNDLLGSRPDKALLTDIHLLLNAEKRIIGYHDLLVHQYGTKRLYVSVDVELDQRLSLVEAHEIVDSIERSFQAKYNAQMSIHLDPINLDDDQLQEVFDLIKFFLENNYPTYDFHDLRRDNQGGYRVDIVCPDNDHKQHQLIENTLNKQLIAQKLGNQINIIWDDHQI